jgi:hypothetical protein
MFRTGWLILLALVLPAAWAYAVHQMLSLAWPERMRRRGGESGGLDGSAVDEWDYQI